jgi:hypothetical protein
MNCDRIKQNKTMSTSGNGNSGDDDTVSSTSTEDEKNNKKGDAWTKDVWENVSDRSFSASDDNKDDDYDDNCNDVDDDDGDDGDDNDDHDDDNYDSVEKKDEQPRKKRKVKSLSPEEESVERIFVHSCEATTKNLCKSLVDFLIGFNMTSERFERKNPLYKIVRNYRSRYSKQLSKGTTLKWFGLDYAKELKKTKSEVHKASKSQIMSRFMKKIRKGLLEREKRSFKDMFSIITEKVCWDENVGVRFVSNSVDKSSKLDESRMLNLYIRKGALVVRKEFELQNTENSKNVIECYHELLFSEVIMYYIIYIIATVHFNQRFQLYIHIYYIILSIVLYIK